MDENTILSVSNDHLIKTQPQSHALRYFHVAPSLKELVDLITGRLDNVGHRPQRNITHYCVVLNLGTARNKPMYMTVRLNDPFDRGTEHIVTMDCPDDPFYEFAHSTNHIALIVLTRAKQQFFDHLQFWLFLIGVFQSPKCLICGHLSNGYTCSKVDCALHNIKHDLIGCTTCLHELVKCDVLVTLHLFQFHRLDLCTYLEKPQTTSNTGQWPSERLADTCWDGADTVMDSEVPAIMKNKCGRWIKVGPEISDKCPAGDPSDDMEALIDTITIHMIAMPHTTEAIVLFDHQDSLSLCGEGKGGEKTTGTGTGNDCVIGTRVNFGKSDLLHFSLIIERRE